MVNGSCAADPGRVGWAVVGVEGPPAHPTRFPHSAAGVAEAERLAQEGCTARGIGGVRPHPVEPLERVLDRDLGVGRHERLVRRVHDRQLEPHFLRVGEEEPSRLALRGDALALQPLRPEVQGLLGSDSPDDTMHHARAGTAAGGSRVLEERQVASGASTVVGVEQVVDGGVVLVDRLLDEPKAEDAGVELDVPGRVARDQGDVVNAFEPHGD